MGKRFNHHKKDKRSRDDANQQPNEDGTAKTNPNDRKAYQSAFHDRETIQNKLFEDYYKGNIVTEEEWDTMIACMREHLPIAFRVSNITGPQKQILNMLNGDCFGLPQEPTEIKSPDGTISTTLCRPQPLQFYRPKGNAFHLDMGRRELKRFPQIEKFREFLILHNAVGNITRQEAVSMIPPLLLDVKSHHVVLDMCAAPGSKTSQLLEGLHNGLEAGEVPTGIVIANDSNPDRAYMLVHQLKRLGSPSFMVTTHEGQTFPTLFAPKASSITSEEDGFREGSFRTHLDKANAYFTTAAVPDLEGTDDAEKVPLAPVLFDRILCDVPCGGDGTMRKTPTVWSNWNLNNSYSLHPLQLMIAWRALQLLKVGGLMVYSTCSINPIEDEAVVMELLRRSNGTVELVKIQDLLPELKHVPGRSEWKDYAEIPARNGQPAQLIPITALSDILSLPEDVQRKIHPTELSPAILKKLYGEAEILVKEKITAWEAHVEKFKAEFPTIELAKENQTQTRLEAEALEAAEEAKAIEEGKKPRGNKGKGKRGNQKGNGDQYVVPGFVRELLRMKTLSGSGNENIHYTTRVLPHQQNTGGFYIALLRKVGQLPSMDETLVPVPPVWSMRYDLFNDVYSYDPSIHAVPPAGADLMEASRINQKAQQESKAQEKAAQEEAAAKAAQEAAAAAQTEASSSMNDEESTTTATTTTTQPKNRVNNQAKWNKDPFVPSKPEIYECLDKIWGVTQKLSLLSRNTSKHYLMSKAVQELILCPQNYRLKTVHGGLKAFELDRFFGTVYNTDDVSSSIKLNYPLDKYFRACQDGAAYIDRFIKRQKITVTRHDMLTLLSQAESTNLNDLTPATKELLLNKEGRDNEDMSNVIRGGSILINFRENDINISVAALKRAYSISLLVDQEERDAYKYIMGAEIDTTVLPVKGDAEDEVQLTSPPQ